MNGIDKITQRITEQIDREIAEIQAKAKEQADAITADYAARIKKETEDILAHGKTAAAEREERLASMAQMEAKKAELAIKQEMLTRAFDLALEKLCALPDEQYTEFLASLAAKAASTGKETVILSQKDRTRVGKAVVTKANELIGAGGALTLSEKTRPIKGGLILSDGAVEFNCTFETMIRLKKTEMAGEVASILFQ